MPVGGKNNKTGDAKVPYVIKGWIMAKYNVFKHDTGRKCLTCLIMNDAFDILLFIIMLGVIFPGK